MNVLYQTKSHVPLVSTIRDTKYWSRFEINIFLSFFQHCLSPRDLFGWLTGLYFNNSFSFLLLKQFKKEF